METQTTPTGAARERRSWRRPAIIAVVILLVLAVIAYLYASSVVYDQISVTAANCGGRFTENTPAAFTAAPVDTAPYLMADYQAITFPSRDPEITISAWYVPVAGTTPGSAVVLVHGHDSCKREDAMLLAAGMLHKDGVAVLLIDMRNHGDSSVPNGRFAGGTREYRDALAGYDWLVNTQGFAPGRVGLLGMSLGAATVLIATGEEPRVAAVWADSSYADLDVAIQAELVRNDRPTWLRYGGYLMARIRSGDDLLSLSPLNAMSKLDGRPIFIVHGTADTRVAPSYAADLAAAVRADGGTVDPWMVEGSEHTQSILDQPAEYERRLDAFFEAALGAN
jgi:dipeptidyl aminopeptidase/acylaminoacyl peptidase